MTTTVAQLPHRWRERAAALDRYAPGAGVAFREAAQELETVLETAESASNKTIERVEAFILAQLGRDSRRLTTSELRAIGHGRRISHANLSHALRSLSSRHAISYEPGPRGAKRWYLLVKANPSSAATLSTACPADSERPNGVRLHRVREVPQESA